MKLFKLWMLAAILLAGSVCAMAQTAPTMTTAGTPEGAFFRGTDIENVQLNDGSLRLDAPLVSNAGRGIPSEIKIVYNSRGWMLQPTCNSGVCHYNVQPVAGHPLFPTIIGPFSQAAAVTYQNVSAKCTDGQVRTSLSNIIVFEADGTQHHLIPDAGQTPFGACSISPTADRFATDGSGWIFKGSATLYRKDGLFFQQPPGTRGVPLWPFNPATIATGIEDTNGNSVSINATASSAMDSLGRSVPAITQTTDSNGNILSQQVPYYDASGTLQTIQVTNIAVPVTTNLCPHSVTCTEWSKTYYAPHIITLPNQLSYTINYNTGMGEISDITLPTGAKISYTYQQLVGSSGFPLPSGPNVQSRTLTVGGQSYVWNYSYTVSSSNLGSTTVVDPLGNQTVYQLALINSSTPPWSGSPRVTEEDFYQGNGSGAQLLKKVEREYWTNEIIEPKAVTTTIYSAVPGDNTVTKSRIETDYDSESVPWLSLQVNFTQSNASEIREFSYDPSGSTATLVRRTHFTYLSDSNPNYAAVNISDRVTDKTLYDCLAVACVAPTSVGSYGTQYFGGKLVAETQYSYDTTPVLNPNGGATSASVPGHDANYGTGVLLRGNMTQVRAWLNTTNSFLTTTNTFDTLGHIITATDPGGHSSTFSYADDWNGWTINSACLPSSNSFAFLTDTQNALGQHSHTTFFPCTGQTQTLKDQNDLNNGYGGTTLSYDSMKRLVSKIVYAAGNQILAQSTSSYSDSLTDLSSTETTVITPTLNRVTKTSYDGLGRAVRTAVLSDPGGTTQADVTYDPLGRQATVTNPYRSTAEATYGVTRNQYDALGRVTQVTKQDGSLSTVAYSGNCATATDEAGKSRKSCSDGLGRLTSVFEDPAGLNYETDYQYDTLGNLLRVDQKGSAPPDSTQWRTRLFTYNSLSQLLTANNPESGTVSYTYDANGNVLSKTDARGIITSFTYDALNRLTQKSYSDGKTSATHFLYDVAPSWGVPITNVIGRLSEVYVDTCPAADGSKAGGNMIFSYDAMGRVILNNQSRPSNCGNGAWPVSATYDLAGNLASITYPSGRVMTYQHNAANNLNGVQFTQYNGVPLAGGAYTYWNVADANFYPNGTPKLASLGNGVSESTLLSKRLQLQEESVTNGALGSFADHAYSYGAQNNGNVLSVADQLNASRTQTFTYDALNRLATANESGGRWGLGFAYDAWGNRLQQNVTAGTAGLSNILVDARNRVLGAPAGCAASTTWCYDLAGNMLNDGFHQYVYDAESRITQMDNGIANYSYDGDGNRVRKDSPDGGTEYLYFGGNVIAERNAANGDWSDYIYANGERIAKADNFENVVHLHGTRSGSAYQDAVFDMNNLLSQAGLANYAIQSGDHLVYRQLSSTPGGTLGFYFAEGGCTGCNNDALTDSDGCVQYWDTCGGTSWHWRTFDLTQIAGKHISAVRMVATTLTPAGNWDYSFADIAVLGVDGTVHPLYNGETTISLVQSTTGMTNVGYEVVHNANLTTPKQTTAYYHGDQIGSSRLLSAGGGWPVWQGTFLPYGEEYNPQITANHYKFTSKERDAESGLDYFGARHYSSSLGRFIQTDPVVITPERFFDPQQLNAYAYVRNNPLKLIDPTGKRLQISGIPGAFSYLCSLAEGLCSRLSQTDNGDGTFKISFNTTGLDLSNNEGAALINDLVQSDKLYDLSIGPEVETAQGTLQIDQVKNLDNNPNTYGTIKEVATPRKGIDDQVAFNPLVKTTSENKLLPANNISIIFHELAEAYAKVDHNKNYDNAHQEALSRENKLRDEHPYLKRENPGGGPGDRHKEYQQEKIIKH